MKYLYIISLSFIFAFLFVDVFAQNSRVNNYNTIGWYNGFGTIKLNNKFGVHTEYQFRRNNFIKDWQQSLLRVGINYQPSTNLFFRLGYAWIETFPYGDIPINAYGKDFTEHRIFEMVQLNHKEGCITFSHRYMLEQRLVGKYISIIDNKENEYPLLNRMRYMLRLQIPFKTKVVVSSPFYLAAYDEVFIGFGKNVTANVFDQNRIGILLGHKFNDIVKLEMGYLNQIIQLGRQVNNRNVFQYNNGLIFNAILNFNVRRARRN